MAARSPAYRGEAGRCQPAEGCAEGIGGDAYSRCNRLTNGRGSSGGAKRASQQPRLTFALVPHRIHIERGGWCLHPLNSACQVGLRRTQASQGVRHASRKGSSGTQRPEAVHPAGSDACASGGMISATLACPGVTGNAERKPGVSPAQLRGLDDQRSERLRAPGPPKRVEAERVPRAHGPAGNPEPGLPRHPSGGEQHGGREQGLLRPRNRQRLARPRAGGAAHGES